MSAIFCRPTPSGTRPLAQHMQKSFPFKKKKKKKRRWPWFCPLLQGWVGLVKLRKKNREKVVGSLPACYRRFQCRHYRPPVQLQRLVPRDSKEANRFIFFLFLPSSSISFPYNGIQGLLQMMLVL